jgi:hypothetical protein
MLILDTDHLSVLQRPKTPAAVALNERLLTAPDHVRTRPHFRTVDSAYFPAGSGVLKPVLEA